MPLATSVRSWSSKRAVALAGGVLLISGSTGCTATSTPTPKTATSTAITSVGPAGPIDSGPTTSATAARCPLLDQTSAELDSGLRLDKITVQTAAGRVIGCRFYPLEHPTNACGQTCLDGEHLPPADQAAIDIAVTRYATPTAAHNAMVRTSEAGTSVQQEQIAPGNTGLCFQITFWSKDSGTDWACAFSQQTTLVIIRTVVTSPAKSVATIAQAVAAKI